MTGAAAVLVHNTCTVTQGERYAFGGSFGSRVPRPGDMLTGADGNLIPQSFDNTYSGPRGERLSAHPQ
jgi:hypothetical protein